MEGSERVAQGFYLTCTIKQIMGLGWVWLVGVCVNMEVGVYRGVCARVGVCRGYVHMCECEYVSVCRYI